MRNPTHAKTGKTREKEETMDFEQLMTELQTLNQLKDNVAAATQALTDATTARDNMQQQLTDTTNTFLADVTTFFATVLNQLKHLKGTEREAAGQVIAALAALVDKILPFVLQILSMLVKPNPTAPAKRR